MKKKIRKNKNIKAEIIKAITRNKYRKKTRNESKAQDKRKKRKQKKIWK